ncbi:MAG: DUF917 family protein [Nocardioides sp.]
MKSLLSLDDVEAAVLGGLVLGGGGGGLMEPGLARARTAAAAGPARLWTVDELPDNALTATVALVGAPSAANPLVTVAHLERSLALLLDQLAGSLAAINTNENGAETTLNGWVQSLALGLPLLDFACNGRAHPTGLMGALGLHRWAEYRSRQAFAGGPPDRHVEGTIEGSLRGAAAVVNRAAAEAGGIIAVARNPVTIGFAARQGAPGAISHAIAVGRAHLDGGLARLERDFGLAMHGEGRVVELCCEQVEGVDVGHAVIDDANATRVDFVNEYLVLQGGGDPVHFPNLIMLFDPTGVPLPSASLTTGQAVQIGVVPAERLLLAHTMRMTELYDPLRALLQRAPRGTADRRDDDDPLAVL